MGIIKALFQKREKPCVSQEVENALAMVDREADDISRMLRKSRETSLLAHVLGGGPDPLTHKKHGSAA